MEQRLVIDALLYYLGLVILLTFHEWGHAWMALKCGDDTAKGQGRLSLNPLVHLDPIGTGLIPLVQFLYPWLGPYLLGWARPVPVNPNNLRSPNRDHVLIALAGPAMNILLAIVLVGLSWVAVAADYPTGFEVCVKMARLSLFLCFFNLIPIPPLDGSHVMRVLVGLDYGVFLQICQYGALYVILIMNLVPFVPRFLVEVTRLVLNLLLSLFGINFY